MTEEEEQYDECAKRILAQKCILAEILVNSVKEFKGMNTEDVVLLIEGEPYVSKVPIEPGATNRVMGRKIVGSNTENSEMYEGMIRYDIVFYVWMCYGLAQMIINIEAQKDEPTEYDILNRAIFYICRMISSQKERDFVKSNYNDMKPVYSIWICMNMSENSLSHIHLTERRLMGDHTFKGNLDLINIIMLGVPNDPDKLRREYKLHRLLGILFTDKMTKEEKIKILEKEYQISMNETLEKELEIMCNLGRGMVERGIKQGIEQGIEQGIAQGIEQGMAQGITQGIELGKIQFIISMHDEGYAIDKIAKVAKMNSSFIKKIIKENSNK